MLVNGFPSRVGLNDKNKLMVNLFTVSCVWVAPKTGYYYITCVGKGGDGGSNADYRLRGGSSGGISMSRLWITKDTSMVITVTNGISSFGSYLSATAGGKEGGAAGTASGGNILNADGIKAAGADGANVAVNANALGGAPGGYIEQRGGSGGSGLLPYLPGGMPGADGVGNTTENLPGGKGYWGGGGSAEGTLASGGTAGTGGQGGCGSRSTGGANIGAGGGGGGGLGSGGGGGQDVFKTSISLGVGTGGQGGPGGIIIEYMI